MLEHNDEDGGKETMEKVEYWDIYDKNKQRTGRKMKRNDWCLKDDEYHLTVLGVEKLGTRLVGSVRRGCDGRRGVQRGSSP